MKKQVTFSLLLLLLLVSSAFAQVSQWYNLGHRNLGLTITQSTRLDTIVTHSLVLIDSLIRYVQLNGVRADAYSSLSAALDAANSATSRKYVVVNSSKSITADYTIPATVGLVVETGGTISVSSGVTLTIRGPFTAPPNQQVFSGSGTVIFDLGATPVYFSEWFGAKNDSTTDSGTAIKKTLDAMPNGGILQLLPTGLSLYAAKGYIVNTTIRVPPRKNLVIEGNGAVIYSSATDTVFLIQNGSQTTIPSYALSPTTIQPRHVFNSIRFKRITGYTGLGVAIALVNSTGQAFNDIDVADYNNAFVFHNISDGWCENNEIFNSRIAGCDTAIAYMLSQSGNNSMATNSLRKVTITRFTDSDVVNQGQSQAVGIFGDTGTNLYRNVWDQVVIFPKDSVTCVNIDGKAEDLTGTINFEYIGSTETSRMRGFHFGSSSSELRFKLHMNLTGRRYFDEPNIFYSQVPGSYSYTGITTTLDGAQNHGNVVVVDSTKFTPLGGIINNARLGMVSPSDTAHIAFWNTNNSGDGVLDIRGRAHKPFNLRSMADGVYSSAHGTVSVGGSSLPLQSVRLRNIGGMRTVNDSTTIDIRMVDHLIVADNDGAVNTLTAFKGGIAGSVLTVTFSSSKTTIANLSGSSGTGRIFLLENQNVRSQEGMKSFFKCESESGGVFWREMWRSAEYGKTTDFSTVGTDSIDVSQVNFIRLNHASTSALRNLFNGIDGQIVEVLHRTANTRVAHLGRGVSHGFSMIDSDSLQGFIGLKQTFQYDGQDDLWREISRSSGLRTNQGTSWTKSLTAGAATNVVSISVASGSYVGGYVDYTVNADDGTDFQAREGRVAFQAVNKAGTETAVVSGPAGNSGPTEAQDGSSPAASSGTLTYTWDTSTSPTNGFLLRLNAASSLTETTLNIRYKVVIVSGTATVTPQ